MFRAQVMWPVWMFLACNLAAGADVAVVAGHQPIAPGEHPRLIVRGEAEVEALRTKAQTPWGVSVVDRTQQALKLMTKSSIVGQNQQVLKEAGYRAAGHAAVYLLEGTEEEADAARKVALGEVMGYPLIDRLPTIDRASRLMGLALAYDMAYPAWDGDTRDQVRAFMRAESDKLLERVGGLGVDKLNTRDHTQAVVVGSVGLAELAMLGDTDDADAPARLAAIETFIHHYLDTAVASEGFGVGGEAVKQAAFASGILPFVRAHKLVMGRDLTTHEAVATVLRPAVLMTVPNAGMPVVGGFSAAVDRSGIFAMSTELAPEQDRPVIAWLFEALGGERYLGVVRPHHGLYMLGSGLDTLTAAPPAGERWPTVLQSQAAGVVVARTGWMGDDDLAAVFDHGRARLIGRGARWLTFAARDAAAYSHAPGAARLDNQFGFSHEWVRGQAVYKPQMTTTLDNMHADPDARTATARFTLKGSVQRTKEQIKVRARGEDGKTHEQTIDIPVGGDFAGQRVVGIDYSGRSGAPAAIYMADTITGGGQAPRFWTMHLGYGTDAGKFTLDANTFTHTIGGQTLTGTIIYPVDAVFEGTANPPYANFVTIRTTSESVRVMLTLTDAEPPAVKTGNDGTVRVGNATYRLHEGQIIFGE